LNVGLLIGFFGGGWIAQTYGWRYAFLASGAPGLALAILLMTTVKEPVRGVVDRLIDDAKTPSLLEVTRFVWKQMAFRWIALGCSMSAFGGYAGLYFIPKFLYVTHHMSPAEIGVALSLLTGVFGAVGTYMAGFFADKYGKQDVRWNMYVPILAACIALPFAPLFYLTPNTAVALCAAAVPALMGAAYLGPSYAMTQGMVPLRMRAQAIAILLFILNMIALGLGPLTVGIISDLLKPHVGADSLRYALLSTVITSLLGAYCYWRATDTLKADLARGSAMRFVA